MIINCIKVEHDRAATDFTTEVDVATVVSQVYNSKKEDAIVGYTIALI